MDKLTGCPDEAMLAMAETAALAHWKTSELQNGTLSVRELVRRGDQIEQALKSRPESCADLDHNSPEPLPSMSPSLGETGLPIASGLPMAVSSPLIGGQDSTSPTDDMRRTVAMTYRETAIMYLNTVISGAHPGVPEIASSVATLSDLLQRLPVTDFDRAIILPLSLTGCLAEDPLMRELIKQRCMFHHDDYVGNMYQARTLVETVWNRRASLVMNHHRGVAVEWRECLRDRWSNLLLS